MQSAKVMGEAMKAVAQQNPIYPSLEPFQQLKRITELVKSTQTALTQDNNENIPPTKHKYRRGRTLQQTKLNSGVS